VIFNIFKTKTKKKMLIFQNQKKKIYKELHHYTKYMLNNTNNEINFKVLLTAIRFFVSYIKYFFLTGSVIFSLTVLLLIILNINPNFSFNFLQYFSFINPIYKTESFSMGTKEIMQIFSVVTFILFIIITLIKFILKKMFGFSKSLSLKLKIILFFIGITLTYSIAFAIVAFSDNLDKGFYFVLIIFYFINLVSAVGYFLLDALLNKISQINYKES
ncbi:MAG: hypothetical protein PHT94_02870, partial [Candidatus Nanoarchaeia archaeon]|nr:hypothetical protein [Candidatus Nanoarchaeia archaeon]